jgi:hypothetical protein
LKDSFATLQPVGASSQSISFAAQKFLTGRKEHLNPNYLKFG